MNRLLLCSLLSIFAIRCRPTDSIVAPKDQGLAGTWLLYETGYSPGGGYIINKVATTPRQTVTFTADGNVEAQGNDLLGYQSFTHYRLDTINTIPRIHFSPSTPDYSDILYLKGDTLRLYLTRCVEGCHYGFFRIRSGV